MLSALIEFIQTIGYPAFLTISLFGLGGAASLLVTALMKIRTLLPLAAIPLTLAIGAFWYFQNMTRLDGALLMVAPESRRAILAAGKAEAMFCVFYAAVWAALQTVTSLVAVSRCRSSPR